MKNVKLNDLEKNLILEALNNHKSMLELTKDEAANAFLTCDNLSKEKLIKADLHFINENIKTTNILISKIKGAN